MNHKPQLLMAIVALAVTAATSLAHNIRGSDPVIYRLAGTSTYQHGCFEGCACPLGPQVPMRGTFALTLVDTNPLQATYHIDQLNWTVAQGNPELRITGSGQYEIGGEFALTHRLRLKLKVGDQPMQYFDSGWQVGGVSFPDIDILASMNDLFCVDTALSIAAAPVRQSEVVSYTLQSDAIYQQGCFDPCSCLIWEEQPMSGSFVLVPVVDLGTYREFAVMKVNWMASGGNIPAEHHLKGFGTYTHIDGFAGPIHQLVLDLSVDGALPAHFDSGLVNTDSQFPTIDVIATMNNMVCYDVVLDVHAERDGSLPSGGSAALSPPKR